MLGGCGSWLVFCAPQRSPQSADRQPAANRHWCSACPTDNRPQAIPSKAEKQQLFGRCANALLTLCQQLTDNFSTVSDRCQDSQKILLLRVFLPFPASRKTGAVGNAVSVGLGLLLLLLFSASYFYFSFRVMSSSKKGEERRGISDGRASGRVGAWRLVKESRLAEENPNPIDPVGKENGLAMKVRCTREPLLAALQSAAAVVPTRSPKPVLTNVKLEANNTAAVLSATDLEVGIRIEIEGVETAASGAVLLPSTRLAAIVRESAAGTVFDIYTDGTAAVIKGPRSEFRLPVEDALEFPAVATFPADACFALTTRLMRELVKRTVFATDSESSRFALGGVLLEFTQKMITAVGTDGRRLARMQGPITTKNNETDAALPSDAQPIVPARAMQLIDRCLNNDEAPVWVALRANEILVHTGQTTISARLVEGRFPRWRDVFPERPDAAHVPLVAGPMLAAVRQAAIVTSEQSKGVDFTFESGQLVLAGRSAESGESRIELPIDYTGATVKIKMDPRFMSDFLRVLEGGTSVSVEITDGQSACVCRTEDGYGYVIMPLAAD